VRLVAAACVSQRHVPFGPPRSPAEDYRALVGAADLVTCALNGDFAGVVLENGSPLLYAAWLLAGPLDNLPGPFRVEELSQRLHAAYSPELSVSLQRLGVAIEPFLKVLSTGDIAAVKSLRRSVAAAHGSLSGRVIDASWRHTVDDLDDEQRQSYADIAHRTLGDDPYAWLLAHHFAEAWDSSFSELCTTVRLLLDAS
jgi:hypothetical protein